MTFRAILALSAASAALAGCAPNVEHEGRARGGALNPGVWSSSTAREAEDVERSAPAVAALPSAAGRVVGVRERRLANGLFQRVTLAGDPGVRGENAIEVTIRSEAEGAATQNLVELPSDASDVVEAELERRFPGMTMRIQDVVLRNAYGPYGLAVGASGRTACVYMWQSIDNLDGSLRRSHIVVQPREASLRVRLCRSGVSANQLAQWAGAVVVDVAGAAPLSRSADLSSDGRDALADARSQGHDGVSSGARFAGYAAPPPAAEPVRAAQAPRPASRTQIRAAARRRSPAPAYARAHEPAPEQAVVPAAAPPSMATQAPPAGYAPYYGQPAAMAPATAAPAYVAPGQPIWTQPGAAAIAQSVGYAPTPAGQGVSAGGAGPLGLPSQAFSGPSAVNPSRAPITR